MQVDYNILIAYGGVVRKFAAGEVIFREHTMAYNYYQLITGEVKLYSTSAGGKEIIQGIFKDGQSFGEPPLLLGKCYPSTAQANTACVVLKIKKEHFLSILNSYPDLCREMMYSFAERIYHKANAIGVWVQQTPEEKILKFLDNERLTAKIQAGKAISYTRQQIADFTGLRVETVIRTLSRMSKEGKVKIIDHKLYY